MNAEETIRQVLDTDEEVKVRADLMNLNKEREALQKAALEMSAVPIIILTRTENGWPYFIVRRYFERES